VHHHHHHAEGTDYHFETCMGEVHVCLQVSLQALTLHFRLSDNHINMEATRASEI
jgi:hypothetical protein